MLAKAVATEADVLVLSVYNSAAKMAFEKLKAMRATHAFSMVWAPQPVRDESCAAEVAGRTRNSVRRACARALTRE